MKSDPHDMKTSDKVAVFLLALPTLALQEAGRKIKAVFVRNHPAKAKEQAMPNPLPVITKNQQAHIADRVCSAIINTHKVCFYQYFNEDIIRTTSRRRGVLYEMEFTPSIAQESDLTFNFDGAIEWVRTTTAPRSASASPTIAPRQRAAPAPAKSMQEAAPAATNPVADSSSRITPPEGNKGRPFTGRILFMGEVTRQGRTDKKPYVTYSVKLASESGSYEKEFIGEHLAELATSLELKVGMLTKIQLLGKHHFTVQVDGKVEPRSRNEFAVSILK